MNILFETITILEAEGYKTEQVNDSEEKIYFEDESLLGFMSVHNCLLEIIETWKKRQDTFLNKNAFKLKTDPTKAWNTYSVYLTFDSGEKKSSEKIAAIEENFRGSRKIVGSGIQTKDDLARTLLPLLSIQKTIAIQPEDTIARLQKNMIHPEILKNLSTKDIFNIIIGKK